MKGPYDEAIAEVQRYLNSRERRKLYIRLQSEVKRYFNDLKYTAAFNMKIASVYTRADVDPDNQIKSERKIGIKLQKWRDDPRDHKIYKPTDIHDIGGATVVCAFPSDLEEVVDFLRSQTSNPKLAFVRIDYKEPAKTGGYAAYHIVVHGRGPLEGAKCEIQLKTVLTEAWGKKTHSLTYKPAGDIDQRLQHYMEKLSLTLNLLDEQSEILKSQITEVWNADTARRTAARKAMLMKLHDDDEEGDLSLLDFLESHEQELATGALGDDVIVDFELLSSKYKERNGLTLDYCRILTVYALNRLGDDRNTKAIDAIDDWIDTIVASDPSGESEELRKAVQFKSLATMALGEYAEAIAAGEWVLAASRKHGDRRMEFASVCNLAYFHSEACYHRFFDEPEGGGRLSTQGSQKCANRALELVEAIDLSDYEDEPYIAALDTIGSVYICCRDDENGIREGLRLCSQALEASQDKGNSDEVKLFFNLHEKRAFRRLLSHS